MFKENAHFTLNSFRRALVEKGFTLITDEWVNNKRDLVLTAKKGNEITTFYVKPKHDFFNSFSRLFPDQKGVGDSINKTILDKCVQDKVSIIVFEHGGKFYYAYPLQLYNYANNFNLIRRQDTTGELTYSFPLDMLQNFERYFPGGVING